ncbi:hypothetical protein J6590_020655 [Homalodisca vitripennis]|nr:hypothetical protein J6590_020655 [Homalodisca vitripennis]
MLKQLLERRGVGRGRVSGSLTGFETVAAYANVHTMDGQTRRHGRLKAAAFTVSSPDHHLPVQLFQMSRFDAKENISNSPTEHAAPLKKRRLARESISEDHSFTPPTTPTHTAEALSQMTDEEDTVSSPQDNLKPTEECPDDGGLVVEQADSKAIRTGGGNAFSKNPFNPSAD